MTLIVGVKCEDGMVVGADGAATSTTVVGVPTSRQSIKKLTNLENRMIVGVSGPVGLGQLIVDAVARLSGTPTVFSMQGPTKRRPEEAMVSIQKAIAPVIHEQMQLASQFGPFLGQPQAVQPLYTSTVVAVNVHSEPCLFSYDQIARPEMTKPGLPFVASGSGQPIAEPFLAFLRRVFWPDKLPTYGEGLLAVIWTLQHAIKTNPGGVADPIQVLTLRNGTVRELSDADLDEYRQHIDAAEKSLKDFKKGFTTGEQPAPPLPQPPKIPPKA